MGKSHAPSIDKAALDAYKDGNDPKLTALRNRFLQFEEQRTAKEMPTPQIALEAISALMGARLEGVSDDQLRACWPESWQAAEIRLPASLVLCLSQCWLEYTKDTPGRTFGEVLGIEGGGQGSQRTIKAQKKRDQDRRFAREVVQRYARVSQDGKPTRLDEAIEAVAEQNDKSFETVKNAYKKYGATMISDAEKTGILKGDKNLPKCLTAIEAPE